MRTRLWFWLGGLAFLTFAIAAGSRAEVADGAGPIVRLDVEGVIDPVTARYLDRALAQAERASARLVVLVLDTPGGLDPSMRDMAKRILAARVPIAVYVAPAGARAASAGVFLSLAAPLLAMAPGTNLGAAHPVDLQGRGASAKITNDAAAYLESLAKLHGRPVDWARRAVRESLSTPADEAVRLGVADLIAPDLPGLLRTLEGRTVLLPEGACRLQLAGAPVQALPMKPAERWLHALANPNVVYILFLLGIYGLIYELASPGAILPGVVGAIAILLALMGFAGLPISLTGLLLMVLGAGLWLLELFVVSHGILAVGGLAAVVLGSVMLFPSSLPDFRVATSVLVSMLSTSAAYLVLILWVLIRSRHRRVISGVESLIGERGRVKALTADGALVHVHGEDWLAEPQAPGMAFSEGQEVEIVTVAGLKLRVRPCEGNGPANNESGRQV